MISADTFWKWFKDNNAKFFFLNQIEDEQEKEKILSEFLLELHKYSNKLFFQIGGYPDDTQDLIITAEGNTGVFDTVEELVSQAPKIKDWNIIAFKPPADSAFITEYKDLKLDPKAMWFVPLENKKMPEQLGLKIYAPNYSTSKRKDFLTGIYILLDSLLGEKSSSLNIHHIDIDELTADPEEKGLIQLNKLPEYIHWKKPNA